MTDKQIIIDGIDVNGCVQFIQDEKDCCNLGGSCKGWTNCYYKKWQRKEQECEHWKHQAELGVDTTDRLTKELEEKEQECEELKQRLQQCWKVEYSFVEQLDKLEADNDSLKSELMQTYCYLDADKETIDLLKADNEELKKCYKNNLALLDFEETNTTKLVNKVMKLEKTLTEIKEIAKNRSNYPCGKCIKTEILQKIKECEVENEQ